MGRNHRLCSRQFSVILALWEAIYAGMGKRGVLTKHKTQRPTVETTTLSASKVEDRNTAQWGKDCLGYILCLAGFRASKSPAPPSPSPFPLPPNKGIAWTVRLGEYGGEVGAKGTPLMSRRLTRIEPAWKHQQQGKYIQETSGNCRAVHEALID